MKSFVHALGNILLTVVVMILIVYGWVFLEVKLLLKPYPELFGYIFYLQNESDMSPDFEAQDIVIVKKDDAYKSGDIVLYFDSKDSKYKVHFVVSADDKSIVTKSAEQSVNNVPVSKDNVLGRAVGKVLFMGAIVAFFTNKVTLISIATIGIVFLVISQYMEYRPKKDVPKANNG